MTTLSHLDIYNHSLGSNDDLKNKVANTIDTFQTTVLDDYDHFGDRQVLLYGDVQSGKTSHMLGIVAQCLDGNFNTVIVLTSPNTRLVQQTYDRVFKSFSNALVCHKDDADDFLKNQQRLIPQKSVIVIGKIPSVLKTWLQTFRQTRALEGNPVLIIDDEADATSLNTKVNKADISTINQQLTNIRKCATGCVYVQVTATPQATLLQSNSSGWAAERALYFKPGDKYIGGEQFFQEVDNPYTRLFSNSDLDEQRYLTEAVHVFMLTAAIFKYNNKPLCNMLVHPSHNAPIHDDYTERVKKIISEAYTYNDNPIFVDALNRAYDQLVKTYPQSPSFDTLLSTLGFMEGEFNTYIVNSKNHSTESDWAEGYNIVVGGNSLGRGLTFDYLQTVFYVRESKKPQADTLWQHARMFGYKRHKETMRVYMPASSAKTFHEVHLGNENIKRQLDNGVDINDIRVVLGKAVSPTRPVVLDQKKVGKLSGGVNYFASDPINKNFTRLDRKLLDLVSKQGEDSTVSMKAMASLLDEFKVDSNDLDLATFKTALLEFEKTQPQLTARIVIRTGRRVNHGTGVLLSPTDQKVSREETARPLLVLYRIEDVNAAAERQGRSTWSSDPIWVPNIKLPGERLVFRVDG